MSTNYSELLKIDIIIGAYSQMRISGITSQPSNDDLETALIRLEDMAAEFASRNMSGGYNLEETPDPNSFIGVNRAFKQAYETNLAVRLIPDFNKIVPDTLMRQAAQSLSNLAARTAITKETVYPRRMARGSGNTLRYFRWDRFYRTLGPDPATTNQLRVGDINNYSEDFSDYLREGEDIQSFTVEPDRYIEITASSQDEKQILYTVSVPRRESTGGRYVDIQITTTLGRVDKRRVYFDIQE